jgi:hypothetical protein
MPQCYSGSYRGKGVSPQISRPTLGGSDTLGASQRSRFRFTVREAWNTNPFVLSGKTKIGTFRAVNNAGDLLSRKNYSCGGPNQVSNAANNWRIPYVRSRGGPSSSQCDGTGIPPSTCNVKYVYDSSNYIKFKRELAINRNYNDYSDGGANNGAQVAFRRVKAY